MTRLSHLSIRTRLFLWNTTALVGILLVISVLSYSVLAWSLRSDVDALLTTMATMVREATDRAADVDGHASEQAIRGIFGVGLHETFFQLSDATGRKIAASPRLNNQPLPLSAAAREAVARGDDELETVQIAGGQRVRLLTFPLMRDGQARALVQLGTSTNRTDRALIRYAETLLVLVPLGALLSAVGGAVIARLALRPIDEMARTARRITTEDLALRLGPRGTGDELDRLADTFNGMLARLETGFAEMRRFTADAAHELRTPLTALKGTIEVALRTGRQEREYRRVLASSLEEVEHLIRLAEDLLLLSRASAGPARRRERVDLEALVMEALDVGARLSRGRGVAVRLTEMVPLTVRGDGVALRRALVNLVENAVKYTPAGGRVELSLRPSGGDALLAVQDTGPGIDPADAERIFEPFVRIDASRAPDTGGAGLGLPIARSIVAGHGGTLALESRPGAGCRFTMRLPLAVDGLDAASADAGGNGRAARQHAGRA